MTPITLLFTLDSRYIPQLQVLLTSLKLNNPGEQFRIYLLHKNLTPEELEPVENRCSRYGFHLTALKVEEEAFAGAPVSSQYPREMYYRLLAPFLLPREETKLLYLDPDILVINPLRPLWETDLRDHLFAAASHTGKTELMNSINRVRLKTSHPYYNSGVLLMNLEAGRQEIDPRELFQYAADHTGDLLLPDQDILNTLYGKRILPVEDTRWNYDARDFQGYYICSGREKDLDWVMKNTSILHFCGKAKPWNKGYRYRFGVLYRHYEALACRQIQ